MKILVHLFGRLGDYIEQNPLPIELEGRAYPAEQIRDHIGKEYPELGDALSQPQVLVAVNQAIVPAYFSVESGDELAFLPPVTGG